MKTILKRAACLWLGDTQDMKGAAEIYFDGSCVPNPGIMGAGVFCLNHTPTGRSVRLGKGTNNLAEWLALEEAITLAIVNGTRYCIIRGDSQLVVNQINSRWAIKEDKLLDVAKRCNMLLDCFLAARIEWVPREQNTNADALAARAIYEQTK